MSERGQSLLAKLQEGLDQSSPNANPDTKTNQAWDTDLIPEQETSEYFDTDLNDFLDSIDILAAYSQWCGKMVPKVGNKRESIMISCPTPGHLDNHPSAWINLDKQTWFCGACNEGGDKFDIAAYHFGISDYQSKQNFPELIDRMVESMGYVKEKNPFGETVVSKADPTDDGEVEQESGQPETPKLSVVPDDDDEGDLGEVTPMVIRREAEIEEAAKDLYIDWETMLPPGTNFIRTYMEDVANVMDISHEYHFMMALQGVATAVGSNIQLTDSALVQSNLNVLLYGNTASGKTRAMNIYRNLIATALPWKGEPDTPSSGTKVESIQNSSEALHDMFRHDIVDTSMPNIVLDHASVRGQVFVDELSSLVARASRPGSTWKELVIELYDANNRDVTLRTLGSGERVARSPFCQFTSTSQPRAIHNFLTRQDEFSGFLNRWVVAVGPKRIEPLAIGGSPPDLTVPTNALRSIHLQYPDKTFFKLQGDALAVWEEHFREKIVPLHELDEPMLGRIDLLEKKLIILFTANMRLDQPTAETVQMAISMHDYLVNVFRLFSSHVRSNEFEQAWDDIYALMDRAHAKGKDTTRRILNRALGKKYTMTLITKVLEEMDKADVIQAEKTGGKRGPRTWKYTIKVA